VHFVFPQHSSAGKLADLVVDASNSEHLVSEGLAVLREWIEESIFTLNLSNSPRVLEIFLISSVSRSLVNGNDSCPYKKALDHYGVPQYIQRTKLRGRGFRDVYRLDKVSGRRYLVYLDLYNGLFAHGNTAMLAGINYLQLVMPCGYCFITYIVYSHVIESKTELDVNLLISMLEVVTALLLAGLKPDLNDLYIPQSWLFVLGQRHTWPRTRELHFTEHLLVPLMTLSQEINFGNSLCLLRI